eukprot:266635-Prorocentrum_minimum.AAC.1
MDAPFASSTSNPPTRYQTRPLRLSAPTPRLLGFLSPNSTITAGFGCFDRGNVTKGLDAPGMETRRAAHEQCDQRVDIRERRRRCDDAATGGACVSDRSDASNP